MTSLAVLRASPRQNQELFELLSKENVTLQDFATDEALQGLEVRLASDGAGVVAQVDLSALATFDHIVFWGVPARPSSAFLDVQDKEFSDIERYAFLLSAIHLSGCRVTGVPESLSRVVPPFGPCRSMHLLLKAGWECGRERAHFSAEEDGLEDALRSACTSEFFVVFTRNGWIMPGSEMFRFEAQREFEALCWRTWSLLKPWRLTWSTLHFDVTTDSFRALQLSDELPKDEEVKKRIVTDLLFGGADA